MVAIVIPYYKHTFFEATLPLLQNQTNKQFTVYIGDDASSENPKDLLEKYKAKFTYYYKRFDSNFDNISKVNELNVIRFALQQNYTDLIIDLADSGFKYFLNNFNENVLFEQILLAYED